MNQAHCFYKRELTGLLQRTTLILPEGRASRTSFPLTGLHLLKALSFPNTAIQGAVLLAQEPSGDTLQPSLSRSSFPI